MGKKQVKEKYTRLNVSPLCQRQLLIYCPRGATARDLSKYCSCKTINKCKGRRAHQGRRKEREME